MATLSLKVHLHSQNTTKTISLSPLASVHDACAEIRAKLGDAVGGDDHALFWPAASKWLVPTKALAFYELPPGELVEFKKKHRTLRVRLLDGTIKTVLIDDSLPVLLLSQSVCAKIGIANADEYSLALENQTDFAMAKRTKSSDLMDDVAWLNPERSLPEQGVDEAATLLLKKKFFYSDQMIDRTDPIQLHLIYQQSRDGIISGRHPCTLEEAVQFAALQTQIVHGNHEDGKHKAGFLNLREFLPEEYRKTKEVEKRIYVEHRKLHSVPELTAKHRYVQLCRSLKTYGVTFFAVKEKDPKKNKIIARLVGISKDSILRCDGETKEVLQSWPLTSLRRWAASPSMFTMDFGDYQDAFYSVQTNQGEQMSQLIAGYIDIIIKRKKEADHAVAQGVEEIITTEEVVRPARAQAVGVRPAQAHSAHETVLAQQGEIAANGGASATMGQMATSRAAGAAMVSDIQSVAAQVVDPAAMAVAAKVMGAQQSANALVTDMAVLQGTPMAAAGSVPPNDPSRLLAQATAVAHLAAHLAAVAALVKAAGDADAPALALHVARVGGGLGALGAATRTLHGSGIASVADHARSIANATAQLLSAVGEATTVTGTSPPRMIPATGRGREAMLATAQTVTNAAAGYLAVIGNPAPAYGTAAQRKVQDAAKAVSVATQELVNKAKRVAGDMPDRDAQMRLIEHVKAAAAAASHVAVSSAILAPVAAASLCRTGLADAAGGMKSTVNSMVGVCAAALPPTNENLAALRASAGSVVAALESLLLQAELAKNTPGGDPISPGNPQHESGVDQVVLTQQCDKVRTGCTTVYAALGGEASGIVAGVKSLTMSSTELVTVLKRLAATVAPGDDHARTRLVDAAKALAEATTRMVTAAKESARDGPNVAKQDAVRTTLEGILGTLQVIQHSDATAVPDLMRHAHSLSVAAVMLACDPSVVTAAALAPLAKPVLESVRSYAVAASGFQPATSSPRAVLASAKGLADAVQALLVAASTVPELIAIATAATADVAAVNADAHRVTALANELDVAAVVQAVSTMRGQVVAPAPTGITMASMPRGPLDIAQVRGACKELGSTLAMLVGAATQGRELGDPAAKVQAAVAHVVSATSGLPEGSIVLVGDLLSRSLTLLQGVQSSPRDKAVLAEAVKGLNASVVKLLDGATAAAAVRADPPLPVAVTPVMATAALSPVAVSVSSVSPSLPPAPVLAQGQTQQQDTREVVVGASSAMVAAISQLVTAKAVSGDIKKAAGDLEQAFRKLVGASKLVISQADAQAKAEILELVQAASIQCVELIGSTKLSMTPSDHAVAGTLPVNPREALGNAASSLGLSVNRLLEKCAVVGNLGDLEVVRGMQSLEMASARLASPTLPTRIEGLTFSECLGKLVEDARTIAQIMSQAVKTPANTDVDPALMAQMCNIVAGIADTGMLAAAILSVLPIGQLQPLVMDLSRELSALETATTQQQVLDAASGVGGASSALNHLIKARAATDTVDDKDRAGLAVMASSLTTASQQLIHGVKAHAVAMSPETRAALVALIGPVRAATDRIYAHCTDSSQPIRTSARKVIDAGRHLAMTSTTDRQRLAHHGQALGLYLGSLITSLRDAAPGQRELIASLDQIRAVMAGIDEQLLASAVEGTKLVLVREPAHAATATAVSQLARGWFTSTGQAVGVERDPARPVLATSAFVSLSQAITDATFLDLVKSIGDGLLQVLDALKFSRPADPTPTIAAADDLASILTLRDHVAALLDDPAEDLHGDDNGPFDGEQVLNSVSVGAKELVGLISKCKTLAALRMGHLEPIAEKYEQICRAARACEAQTSDVVLRDRLYSSLEKLGSGLVSVLVDRSKVSQLSAAIQALMAAVQETVRAASQCAGVQDAIVTALVPQCRDLVQKLASGAPVSAGPVVPGAMAHRCNQLLESLNALVGAAESGMDSLVGDAAEASVAILRQLLEEGRRVAAAQRSVEVASTIEAIFGAWGSLVMATSKAATRPPGDPLFDSVRLLADQITQLAASLTANPAQEEFKNLESVIELALRALPQYETELRGSGDAAAAAAADVKSAEEWEQQRNVAETKAVAACSFDLMKAAAVCQREIVTRVPGASPSIPMPSQISPGGGAGARTPSPAGRYMDDGTWSEGLVSAAKQVAVAMQELITAANPATADLVSSSTSGATAPRERLIACAKGVAAATVQVVAAASVNADANAPSLQRLKTAAKAVVASADGMASKLKSSAEVDRAIGPDLMDLKPSNATTARLALLEAQTNVLTMEAELERARARLTKVKKSRYTADAQP
ncbi:hypothetical protein BC828DRAFT_435962 [Blastocladiella britannica]|nr:hypothetical protein BC828DRAFT_435962 [Blastocladiella britannica]